MGGDRLAGISEYDLYRYYREREREAREEEAKEREEEAKKERVALFFDRELRRFIPKEKFDEELARRLIAEEIDFARELLPDPEAPVIEDPRAKVERLLDKGVADWKERWFELDSKIAEIEYGREEAEGTLRTWSPEGTVFKETEREFEARFPEGFKWYHLTDEVKVEVDFETLCKQVEYSIREKIEEGLERYGGEKRFLKALEGEPDPYIDELRRSSVYRLVTDELERCKAETGFFAKLTGRYEEFDIDSLLSRIWYSKPFSVIYSHRREYEKEMQMTHPSIRHPFRVEAGELKGACDEAFLNYGSLEREGVVDSKSYDRMNPLVLFDKHWREGKSPGEIADELHTDRSDIERAFERWEIPRNPTLEAKKRLEQIRENEERLDRLRAERQSVRSEIESLEGMREAVREGREAEGDAAWRKREETKGEEAVGTGEPEVRQEPETSVKQGEESETAMKPMSEIPPSVEEEVMEERETEEGALPEKYELGKYTIVRDGQGYHVSKGDLEMGSFAEGKVCEDENRALFELDKGMLLEVTTEGHREIFSKEKARLHGYVCADGHLRYDEVNYNYSLTVSDGERFYRIRFGEDAKKVYGLELHDYPKREEASIYGKEMAFDLTKHGPINSRDWRVPFGLLDREGARAWLRGYFDGDGSCWLDRGYVIISACSVNEQGLKEVQTLLRERFGIKSRVGSYRDKAHPTWSDSHYLHINRYEDVLKFRDEVGFDGPKQQKLNKLIKKWSMRRNEAMRGKTPLTGKLLHELHWVKGLSTTEIAKKTGWSQNTIYRYMRKEGVTVRSRKDAQRWRSLARSLVKEGRVL